MIVIADSGSTKTDWRYIDEYNNIHLANTIGMNPYFITAEQIVEELSQGSANLFPSQEILRVVFYGAGCDSPRNYDMMLGALQTVFPKADIEIESDLLGAARALCGKSKGMVAILGTGSNSCLYDGSHIAKNVASMGYILGDEGSGSAMGKHLLLDFVRGSVPEKLRAELISEFSLSKEEILDRVYKQEFPNRFLASFSKFLYKNQNEVYVQNLLTECFSKFFENQISLYKDFNEYELYLVGSIAYNFSEMITKIASSYNVQVSSILQSPIAALSLYHLND